MPASWLTAALSTPGTASRAFFTRASQWPHIIPSIFKVFSMIFFSFFFFSAFIFLSLSARCRSKKFSLSALDTTQKLDKLMAAAPNMGFSFHPRTGIKSPMARGMPTTL